MKLNAASSLIILLPVLTGAGSSSEPPADIERAVVYRHTLTPPAVVDGDALVHHLRVDRKSVV